MRDMMLTIAPNVKKLRIWLPELEKFARVTSFVERAQQGVVKIMLVAPLKEGTSHGKWIHVKIVKWTKFIMFIIVQHTTLSFLPLSSLSFFSPIHALFIECISCFSALIKKRHAYNLACTFALPQSNSLVETESFPTLPIVLRSTFPSLPKMWH